MQAKHVPTLTLKYWVALMVASIFGANTGDFLSDQLALGHLSGLPVLAFVFAVVLILERFDAKKKFAYYWGAILIIRTAATNIGDLAHDLKLALPTAMFILACALGASAAAWKKFSQRKTTHETEAPSASLPVNSFYWSSMLMAGALGTVAGDYFSYRLKLGNLYAALVLGTILALCFALFRKGLKTDRLNIIYFWIVVVLIRSMGTAAGDLLCHHLLNAYTGTLASGLTFISLLLFWREKKAAVV